jgi:probable HAF family extracellular repeat protein
MNRSVTVHVGAFLAASLAFAFAAPASAADAECFPTTDRWRATVLDIPGAVAYDINNQGHIVGTSSPAIGTEVPYVWRDGRLTILDAPGSPVLAPSIDEHDDIAGSVTHPLDNRRHALLWRGASGVTDLGVLGGSSAFAQAVDNGFVAGMTYAKDVMYPANARRAFVWKDGRLTMLPVTGGSEAVDVNENGTVVGAQGLGDGFPSPYQRSEHAFIYRDGVVTDLGTLGAGKWSVATAVNDRDQVLGWSATAAHGVGHDAFVWSTGTGFTTVEDGPGMGNPQDINNDGMLVGNYSCTTSYGVYEPAVWVGARSAPLRLPVPADVEGLDATAVNDGGAIVGIGRSRADQRPRAILWEPVR